MIPPDQRFVALLPVKRQVQIEQLLVVRRAQSSHGIPPGNSVKSSGSTSRVAASSNVVEDLRILVGHRVDEPDAAQTPRETLLIDQGQDRSESWAGRGSAVYKSELSIHGDDVVGPVGTDVRIASGLHAIVVTRGVVWGVVVGEVALHCFALVAGQRENVGKSTARVDYGFASLLWLGAGRKGVGKRDVWLHLRCADGGDPWACLLTVSGHGHNSPGE